MPASDGARREPRVIVTHGLTKASVFEATMVFFVHDKENKGGPSTTNGKSKGREDSTSTNRSTSPGKDNDSACRLHLTGKFSKGKDCICWHSPRCRFFKNGNCFAGDKCQVAHKHTTAAPATAGDAGRQKNGDENKPSRRGGSKSGAEPATVCSSSTDSSNDSSGGETLAVAGASGETSHIAITNNKSSVHGCRLGSDIRFQGRLPQHYRYALKPGVRSTRKRRSVGLKGDAKKVAERSPKGSLPSQVVMAGASGRALSASGRLPTRWIADSGYCFDLVGFRTIRDAGCRTKDNYSSAEDHHSERTHRSVRGRRGSC